MSLQTAAGFPLSAALVITMTPPPADDLAAVSPARLAEALADGGEVTVTELLLHPTRAAGQRAGGYVRRDRQHPEVDPMSKDPGYEFTYSVPPRWTRLPVLDNRKMLRHDRKITAWSEQQARAILGPDAPPADLKQRATDLAELTYQARARGAMNGLALYAPPPDGLAAILDVKRLVPDQTHPELTFDVLGNLYAKPSADTLGVIDAQQVELPSGPALRVHRKRAQPGDPTGQSVISEGVTYAIRPPGIDDAIVMIMTWAALQLGDRLTDMTDEIARTVKISFA